MKQGKAVYEIIIRGHLGNMTSKWFEGLMLMALPNGDTRIWGSIVDQAALFGILNRIRDSGLLLVSVNRKDQLPSTDMEK